MAGSWDKTVKRMIPSFGEGGAVSLPQFAQNKDAGKHSKEGIHFRGARTTASWSEH